MKSWLSQRRGSRHVLVQHVPEVLECGGDDARAACGRDGEVQGSICVFDDGGRYGREGPFAGADVVGGRGDVAEGVGGAGDAEVVHSGGDNVSFLLQ